MSFVAAEIASQRDTWQRAVDLAAQPSVAAALPAPGERVAVVGCGTSLYMAQACATLREEATGSETDAFPASEFPPGRRYDRVVALTRSGTTTEVIRLLRGLPSGQRSTVITTDRGHPVAELAGDTVVLDFADEQSVVQTRFATTALMLWRQAVTGGVGRALEDVAEELVRDLDPALVEREQFTFLGTGWTVGIANEAALKVREAAQAWSESYPAMEFRHGPISVIDSSSAVWIFGPVPAGMRQEVESAGGIVVHADTDPVANLTTAQRLAVAVAQRRGLDPDRPRNLTRSIVLPATA